jgi:ABC-type uncharacterized transport system permease subunit
MADGSIGLWTVPLAVFGGAIRVSTPFLFVSLGECITERSGRINLGLEGTLVMGAMSAYGISYLRARPGSACSRRHHRRAARRAACRHLLAAAGQRHRRRHRADAVRHRLAFYLGKPLIEPTAPRLPAIDFGWWSDVPQVRAALRINVLFLIGVALAPILYWAFEPRAGAC